MADLHHLRAFIAVAEELNFTRAAERLHLGQQAVSKSIATLEEQLGVALLERTTRRVTPTPAGEALLESGRDALKRVEAAFAEAQAVDAALSGGVQIGLTPAVGTIVRGEIVEALTREAPELSITFREVRQAEAEGALRHREVDLVISRTPPNSEAFDSAALAPSPARLVVAAGHRLAAREAVPISELDGERLQTWNPRGHPYTDALVAGLAEHGAEVEVVLAQVIGGGGPPMLDEDEVSLLPDGWPTAEGTVALTLEPEATLPLWLLWRQGSVPAVVARIRRQMAGGGASNGREDQTDPRPSTR